MPRPNGAQLGATPDPETPQAARAKHGDDGTELSKTQPDVYLYNDLMQVQDLDNYAEELKRAALSGENSVPAITLKKEDA